MKNIEKLEETLEGMSKVGFDGAVEQALKLANPDGLFLEFGVSSGGSLRRMAQLRPDLHFFGFDSFEGLPEKWNGHDIGAFKSDIPDMPENVTLYKGWFNDSLPLFVEEHQEPVSFVNIDSDLYSSAKTIFSVLRFQIIPGSIIRFDELTGYADWRNHEYKALCEFLLDTGYDIEVLSREDDERAIVRVLDK